MKYEIAVRCDTSLIRYEIRVDGAVGRMLFNPLADVACSVFDNILRSKACPYMQHIYIYKPQFYSISKKVMII